MSSLANGRVILKFNNSALEQKASSSLYSNFILNLCTSMNWLIGHGILPIIFHNFFLFGTIKLVRHPIKIKFIYYGQGIAFHGEQFWGFDNDSAKYVVISGVDNSLSISYWYRKK